MNYSIAIMTIPERYETMKNEYLINEKTKLKNSVIAITEDRKDKNPRKTAMRAFCEGLKINKKWHLVLEDDLIFCNEFSKEVEKVLNFVTNDIDLVSFSCITPNVWKHHKPGIQYIVKNVFAGGQAIAIKTKLIPGLLHCMGQLECHQGDYAISTYTVSTGKKIAFTFPQLVQHKNIDSYTGCDALVGEDKRKCPDFRKNITVDWTMNNNNTLYVKEIATKKEVKEMRKKLRKERIAKNAKKNMQ